MMYTGFELLWLFFFYSFLGWVLETAAAAVRQRRIVNRGLINGPFCIIYGFTAVLLTLNGGELRGIWLFGASAVYASFIELVAGKLIERIYHERWWDYSKRRLNLSGYVCLSASLLWGALGYLAIRFLNPLLLLAYRLLPRLLREIGIWCLLGVLAVDVLATLFGVYWKNKNSHLWSEADSYLAGLSMRLGNWITDRVEQRIKHAYPVQAVPRPGKQETGVFAQGAGFYKLVMLFFIGAFLGDITETIFCRITAGVWMSRSSVVWGPFSIVWGLAIAVVTALLYKEKDRPDSFLFLMGTILGGAYEYLCSVFTELVFGTVFWDYSHIPFNLGGRINLLYCFFWGIAAVVWFKMLYPRLSALIERLPMRGGKLLTWCLIFFMMANVAVSCMALVRYDQRRSGVVAESSWQKTIDAHFPDQRMERIYPNALQAD